MFKNLKDKLATQVTKTNQALFANIIPTDSASPSRDSGTRTSSITSRDENQENNRSRLDSASSDISQTANTSITYTSPSRQHIPPSDIESETGGEENDDETNNKLQKLRLVYKDKFTQLKKAYDEVEHEKDHIKNILQQHQDTSIKRQSELRQQIKLERQAKEQLEGSHRKEINLRDNKIQELTQQVTIQKDLVQSTQDEIQNLRDKNTKLAALLTRCKEDIKTHNEKQAELVKERDDLSQQVNEKQTFIESMMKERQSVETTSTALEVREHFDSDITVLLNDKERLQEQLESARHCVRQLEIDLDLAKQQQPVKSDSDEDIKHERDELKQKYEDLLIKFNTESNLEILNKEFQDQIKNLQETIVNDKQQIEQFHNEIQMLKESLSNENEQHLKSADTLKTEYENLTNELHQTKQAKDNIQVLLDETTKERTIYKDKYEQIQQQKNDDTEINQLKTSITKLQQDYNESLSNNTQLTQKLETQRQEHLEELATVKTQQQIEFDNKLKELNEEENHFKSQIEEIKNEHKKTIETLNTEFKNTHQEQLSAHEDELKAAAKISQDKLNELSSQLEEEKKKLSHHEEKSSRIEQLEKEIEILKSQSNLSQKELGDEYNSLKEQYQQTMKQNEQLTILKEELNDKTKQLRDELDEKVSYIKKIESQLEEKQNEITQLNTKINEMKETNTMTLEEHEQLRQTIHTLKASLVDDRQLLEQKNKEVLDLTTQVETLKQKLSDQQSLYNSLTNEQQDQQSHIDQLKKEHQQSIDELTSEFNKQKLISESEFLSKINEKTEELTKLQQQLTSQLNEQENLNTKLQQYSELEEKLNNILTEKNDLENQLDTIRIQVQNNSDDNIKLETEIDSYRNEIQTLKTEIISLINLNEENTRRIDEFDNEKFNFEQENNEKDRQLIARDEKIQELELDLKQTQESATKLRKALQKMKEPMTTNEQTNTSDTVQLRITSEEYEQRLKEQEAEYDVKLKAMAKEMSSRIDESEQNYKEKLAELIENTYKTENELKKTSEQKIYESEQRALISEEHTSKMQDELKEKQLDHYRLVHDLQSQIQRLKKESIQTMENFSQTTIEELNHSLNNSTDSLHSFVFEPTEVDYLRQIVLAYMTGTDRITMAKVICAVLRYTDNEKSLILEHEKLRQTRWLKSTR